MHSLIRDLRHAARTLARSPGFTLFAVATLAFGIGATTAVFSVVHQVVLEPLSFPNPDRLVSLWELSPDDAGRMRRSRATAGNISDWRAQASSFDDIAFFGAAGVNWTGDGEPEQLLGARVSASYFSVLGASPLLGRGFLPEEEVPGQGRVVILGHGLWQRRFGGATDVLGKSMTLNGAPYEIVGVMPPGVYPTWPQATGRVPFLPVYQQMWVPMQLSEQRRADRRSHLFGALGRLRTDVSIEEARTEMRTIARRLEAAFPDANEGKSVVIEPLTREVQGGARPALFVLLAAVGLVLLTACANLASLFLARSATRRREVALRTALGAGRWPLVRQFLTESTLLGLVGGLLGTGVAALGIRLLILWSPQEIPRLSQAGLGAPVLAFVGIVSILTGLLFGLAPALQLSTGDVQEALRTTAKGGSSASASSSRFPLRRFLVVAEISVAVVLVVGAGLLVRSFQALQNVDVGFSANNVLVANVDLPSSKYSEWLAITQFHTAVVEQLEALPTVEHAAWTYDHALESNWIDSFRLDESPTDDESLAAVMRIVSAGYFQALGINVVQGRAFTELDDPDHPGAIIVNEAFVRRYISSGNALGRRITTSTPWNIWGDPIPKTFEIVGVVNNVKFLGVDAGSEPAFYLPARQFPSQSMVFVARTSGDPAMLGPELRARVRELDPDLPISSMTTMSRLLSENLAQPRFNTMLLALFGVTALALAGMGIYGLLSYSVAERTSEIGLRMALGAQARDVVRLFLRQGTALIATGVGIGLVGALVLGRLLSSLLFGIRAHDPGTFVAVTLFLSAVAALASYLPARRATRIDPIKALRQE